MSEIAPHSTLNGFDDTTLRGLARRQPLVVAPTTSLRDTLYRISQKQEDAAIIVDSATGMPLGLVTLRDLLHAIGFENGGLDDPIAAHMLGGPLTLAADTPAHRAKVTMAKRGIGHLVLTESDGRLFGWVTQADLLGLGAGGAEALIAAIGAARDLSGMAVAADRVRRRGAELFHAGMGVDALCQWISGLHDLIGMRIIEIIEIIEDEYDLPPVPWCWLVFGSEGRLEQTFASDQDNGLLFVPPEPESTDAMRQAFLPFAKAVNQALHHCGIERCRGDIMAGNPDCCLSAAEWRQRFATWLRTPDPQALLNSTIFFDFRPLLRQQRSRGPATWLADRRGPNASPLFSRACRAIAPCRATAGLGRTVHLRPQSRLSPYPRPQAPGRALFHGCGPRVSADGACRKRRRITCSIRIV